MNNILIFENEEFGKVRTVIIDGEPWFVGKDVAVALGYEKPTDAARKHVDEEDRGVSKIETPSGTQTMTIINESGMYSLVFGSKLEEAKRFKHWVTSEVLPAIRKKGRYDTREDGKFERGFLKRNGINAADVLNFMCGDESYHPKATSVSEVVNLLQYFERSMEMRGYSQEDIARMTAEVCAQFNILVPGVFLPPDAPDKKADRMPEEPEGSKEYEVVELIDGKPTKHIIICN